MARRPIEWASVTQLNQFETCPKQFEFRRIMRIPEGPFGTPAAIGKIVHDTIARYTRHLVATEQQTDITKIGEFLHEAFFKAEDVLSLGEIDDIVPIVERYAGSRVYNPDAVIGIEDQFKIPLRDGRMMVGVIDLYEQGEEDDHLVITDFKTDQKVRSQAEVDKDWQLLIYAWAAQRQFPKFEAFTLNLDFVRFGITRTREITSADLVDVEDRILGRIAQIEEAAAKKNFKPKPGAACAFCSYAKICPAIAEPTAPKIILDEDGARRTVEAIAALERQLREHKTALKYWAAANGDVSHNGIVWGHRYTKTDKVKNVAEFIEIATKNGWNLADLLKVDTYALRGLARDEEMAAMIEHLLVDGGYSKFESKKAEKDGEL